ncbi:hypothetical protein MNBD_GAMMA08-256 [hydrothermal vent metagenome]|uniref:Uncharacterized protein n=1 Tax=hydrothermal vent metagenome TaxID=652676 RepID=A0A3B0XV66_9ZZZZ
MDFDLCGEVSKKKIISVSENKMNFRIRNKHLVSIRTVTVDGCLINDKRLRCDYLFEIGAPCNYVIYLELKGCDVKKALKQLESTIQACTKRHASMQKSCYVIASRVPKIGTKIQALKKKFVLKNLASLTVCTTKDEVVL